jgi:hypothetical protein
VSFIARFKDAVIGFSGYPRLARDKAGGFGYIAILLLIVLTLSGTVNTVKFGRLMTEASRQLEKGPDFALKNGEVRFDGPMPYRVTQDGAAIIIDTTGKTTVDDIRKAGPGSMLITKDTVYQVQGSGSVRSNDLHSIPAELTRQDVLALLPRLPRLVPVGYVLLYMGQLGGKALDAVVLALVALLYGRVTGRRTSFDLGYKLGLYAVSLPILIQWIPWPWWRFTTLSVIGFTIWWGLAILYLLMGLRACHNSSEAAPFYRGQE